MLSDPGGQYRAATSLAMNVGSSEYQPSHSLVTDQVFFTDSSIWESSELRAVSWTDIVLLRIDASVTHSQYGIFDCVGVPSIAAFDNGIVVAGCNG